VTLEEIREMGLRLAELCEKYGIAELSVFGSVARGDGRPDSDGCSSSEVSETSG